MGVTDSLDEAIHWLQREAPSWRFEHGIAALVPGDRIGAPTRLRVEVTLASADMAASVTGEGSSYLEAVQTAVGLLGSLK